MFQYRRVGYYYIDGNHFSGKGKNNQTPKKCSFCGKQGNAVESCYEKHGYPIGFKKDSKSSVNSSVVDDSDGKTEIGKGLGNTVISQDDYHHLMNILKMISVTLESAAPSSSSKEEHSINQIHTIDAEGTYTSCTINSCSRNCDWILDSGATDHVCKKFAII